tara:strand:+ start:5482 stop:6264 length:783 start_codon:yes stop_codon:yes gene_type:complete
MINFEKWHGNGNDFVIINSIEQKINLKKSSIKNIADRNKGIGFDQLIHVCLPTKDDKDFFVRFYNSDGSEAGMCLNGIRCASRYLWKNTFTPLKNIRIQTKTKDLLCSPVSMNKASVLVDYPHSINKINLIKKIKKKIKREFFLLNFGNNHLCINMNSIDKVDLNLIYRDLEKLIKEFDINLSIFKKNKTSVDIRTFENGVGETLSCGSASLSVASHYLNNGFKSIKISSMGGDLIFRDVKNGILMTGPTSFSYEGNVNE